MAILNISNLKKSFIERVIFDGASLIVEDNDKVGLIGSNGTGKTTLFNIITDKISYDDGSIIKTKDLTIGYLKQNPFEDLTKSIYESAEENFEEVFALEKRLRELEGEMHDEEKLSDVMEEYQRISDEYQKLDGYSVGSKIRGTLIGLGFSEDEFGKKISELSGGQKSRLSLANLILKNPDLLLLDEPTNHLDIESINFLERALRDYKKAVIIISHDRYFLNNIVNKIVLLDELKLTTFNGNYEYYAKERKKQLEIRKSQYENQQKEIKRQEQIIERYLGLGRARFIRQGKSRQKMLDKVKRIEAPEENQVVDIKFPVDRVSGREVLNVENLSKTYDREIFKNISFNVQKGDKVGLTGPNGIGKSTIFKIITGKIKDFGGEFKIGTNVDIGYFDQEMRDLDLDNTVLDEIWDEYPKLKYSEIRKYLAQFLFIDDDILKTIRELSGGEKARVAILKIILKGSNFLLLDEPTNHLDIDSKEALEDALLQYEGTILAISHDRYFLNHVINKLLYMEEDKMTEYLGGYDYFLEKTTAEEEEEEVYISKTERAQIKKEERQKREEKRKREKEFKELEDQIVEIENKLSTIDEDLSNASLDGDFETINKLSIERENLVNKLDSAYEKWMDF